MGKLMGIPRKFPTCYCRMVRGYVRAASCTSHAALPLQAMAGDGAHLFVSADDGTIPLRPGETVQSVLAQRRDLELHSYVS